MGVIAETDLGSVAELAIAGYRGHKLNANAGQRIAPDAGPSAMDNKCSTGTNSTAQPIVTKTVRTATLDRIIDSPAARYAGQSNR